MQRELAGEGRRPRISLSPIQKTLTPGEGARVSIHRMGSWGYGGRDAHPVPLTIPQSSPRSVEFMVLLMPHRPEVNIYLISGKPQPSRISVRGSAHPRAWNPGGLLTFSRALIPAHCPSFANDATTRALSGRVLCSARQWESSHDRSFALSNQLRRGFTGSRSAFSDRCVLWNESPVANFKKGAPRRLSRGDDLQRKLI
jgi:hypothetical protein